MSHEVIKRVGARAYRYRVESYRDAETRKVRSHWTYLGRAEAASAAVPAATPRRTRLRDGQTRERLLEAFERLLEGAEFEGVTAGAVAKAAGVAHGTFYRYFSDKRALLLAAVERLRDEFKRTMPSFEPPYGDEPAERTRLHRWVAAILGSPAGHAGLLRAYLDALDTDTELRRRRLERHEQRVEALAGYFATLESEGVVTIPRREALAAALLTLVDGTIRAGIVAGASPDAATVGGVSDVFERAIFGPERPAC